AWPRPARPNPFLPFGLQRQMKMPRSSAAVELAYSRDVLDRLSYSAPDVVLSYPKMQGERELQPTSLVLQRLWLSPPRELVSVIPSAPLETLVDEMGPPLAESNTQRGGTSLFKDIAACPFR